MPQLIVEWLSSHTTYAAHFLCVLFSTTEKSTERIISVKTLSIFHWQLHRKCNRPFIYKHTKQKRSRFYLSAVCFPVHPFRSNFNLPYFLIPYAVVLLLRMRSKIEQNVSLWMSTIWAWACVRVRAFASLQHSFICRFNCHLPTHQMQNKQINKMNKQKSRERGYCII